jgi:hypothetical protein
MNRLDIIRLRFAKFHEPRRPGEDNDSYFARTDDAGAEYDQWVDGDIAYLLWLVNNFLAPQADLSAPSHREVCTCKYENDGHTFLCALAWRDPL